MSSHDGDGRADGDGHASGDVLHLIRQKLLEQLRIVSALELTLKILTEGDTSSAAVVKVAVAAVPEPGDGKAPPKKP